MTMTTRVLVALSPRMYCEAVALSIRRNRPGLEVRCVPPKEAERELAVFQPRLLVHNDTAPIGAAALSCVPHRLEVLYTDSMNARVVSDGRAEEAGDMDTAGLLGAVDRAAEPAGAGAPRG